LSSRDTTPCAGATTTLPVDDYPFPVAISASLHTAYVVRGVKDTVSHPPAPELTAAPSRP